MVKKFFAFYIVFCIFFSNVAFAEKKETHREYYNDIQEDDLKSIEEVLNKYQIIKNKKDYKRDIKKEEFIESVLKVIGLNDDMVEFYWRYGTHCYDIFFDVGGLDLDKKIFNPAYLRISGEFGIVKGDRISKTTVNLYPDKKITIDECLEIMNRCLNKNVSDDVIYQAKENGLIKDTDKVLSRVHRTLTYEDLCVLLYRFSVKQICYYFDISHSPRYIKIFHFPSDKKMNYLELLESRNSDKRFKWLKRELIKMREREQ